MNYVCRPFRAWIANDLLYRGPAIATPRPVVCQPFGLAIVQPQPLPSEKGEGKWRYVG